MKAPSTINPSGTKTPFPSNAAKSDGRTPFPSDAAEDDGHPLGDEDAFAVLQYTLTKRHFFEAMRPLIYSKSLTIFWRCLAIMIGIPVALVILASVLIVTGATRYDGSPWLVVVYLASAAVLVFLVCNMPRVNCKTALQQNIWFLLVYFGYPDYRKQSVCRVRCSKDYIEFGRNYQEGQFNWMETFRWTDILSVHKTKHYYVLKLDRVMDVKVELPQIFPRFKTRIYDGILIRKDGFTKGDWSAISERLAARFTQ